MKAIAKILIQKSLMVRIRKSSILFFENQSLGIIVFSNARFGVILLKLFRESLFSMKDDPVIPLHNPVVLLLQDTHRVTIGS